MRRWRRAVREGAQPCRLRRRSTAFAPRWSIRARPAPRQTRRPRRRPRRAALRRLPQQCRGRADRRARGALSGRSPAGRRRFLSRHGGRLCRREQAARAGADPLRRRRSRTSSPAFEPARELAYLADVARVENAWVEAYHAAEATRSASRRSPALAPEALPGAAFPASSRPRGCFASPIPPPRSGPATRATANRARLSAGRPEDALVTRPAPTSWCASCRRAAALSRNRCSTARRSARRPAPPGEGFDPGAASRRPHRGRRDRRNSPPETSRDDAAP